MDSRESKIDVTARKPASNTAAKQTTATIPKAIKKSATIFLNWKKIKARKKLREIMLMHIRHKNGRERFIHAGQEPYLSVNKDLALNSLLHMKLEEKKPSGRRKYAPMKEDKGDVSALDGRGIALSFRHQIEKRDPHHRPWKNGLYLDELGSKLEEWQKGNSKLNLFSWANRKYPRTKATNVKYLTQREARQFLVTRNSKDQLIYASKNNQVIDTTASVKEKREIIYVMDLDGNLYVAPAGDTNPKTPTSRLQHPSFTSGERVLCAGAITIENGKVTHINNESGHYLPGAFSLARMVDELERRNVLSKNVKINVRSQMVFVENNKTGDLSLDEFREVIRIWPQSPLAKLDLSEKSKNIWQKIAIGVGSTLLIAVGLVLLFFPPTSILGTASLYAWSIGLGAVITGCITGIAGIIWAAKQKKPVASLPKDKRSGMSTSLIGPRIEGLKIAPKNQASLQKSINKSTEIKLDTTQKNHSISARQDSLLKDTPDEIIPNLFLGNLSHGDQWLSQVFDQKESQTDKIAILRCTKHVPISKCTKNTIHPLADASKKKLDYQSSIGNFRMVSVGDSNEEKISAHFNETFDFIESALQQGKKVLVHCDAGVSRSPTIIIAYLMKKYNLKFDEALHHVSNKRACVNPNEIFTAQLREYENSALNRHPAAGQQNPETVQTGDSVTGSCEPVAGRRPLGCCFSSN